MQIILPLLWTSDLEPTSVTDTFIVVTNDVVQPSIFSLYGFEDIHFFCSFRLVSTQNKQRVDNSHYIVMTEVDLQVFSFVTLLKRTLSD